MTIPPDGKLSGGEYYDIILYWHGASRWSQIPEPPISVIFRCVGHTTEASARWILDNISPNQSLPVSPLHRGGYLSSLFGLLEKALAQYTGKEIVRLYRTALEQPTEGPGTFWRSVPDLVAVANYSAETETTPVMDRVSGNASSAGEQRANDTMSVLRNSGGAQ